MSHRSPIFFSLLLASILSAQEQPTTSPKGFGMFVGGTYGAYFNSIRGWQDHYDESNKRLDGYFGIGYNKTYLTVQYGSLKATGKSKVTNLPIKGVALWNQDFLEAGFRQIWFGEGGGPYIDILYVRSRVRESISTVNPEVPELASSASTSSEGLCIGAGLLGRIVPPVYIDLSISFTFTGFSSDPNRTADLPNLGGWHLKIGLTSLEQ